MMLLPSGGGGRGDVERSCIGYSGGGNGHYESGGRGAVMLVAVDVVIIMKRVVVVLEVMAMMKRALVVVMLTVIMKAVVVLVRC